MSKRHVLGASQIGSIIRVFRYSRYDSEMLDQLSCCGYHKSRTRATRIPMSTRDSRHAWFLEAVREIRTVRNVGIDLINFHANLKGMSYGEKEKDPFR